MRIALINTNRFTSPPVIPVGLEYLADSLEQAGHLVRILDLTFSRNPSADTELFLLDLSPDVIGFSVRNIDSVLYPNNKFFLDEIAEIIRVAKETSPVPTVAGGSSTLCSRENLRNYLGVDCLVTGPGENAILQIISGIEAGVIPQGVINGYDAGINTSLVHQRGTLVDYAPYLSGNHPAGIVFQVGCPWECPYCVERKRPVITRDIDSVVAESRLLYEAGAGSFFFCDSEFNLDLERSQKFLETFLREGPGIEWTAYFRPYPFNDPLAGLLRRSKCSLVNLSVNSWELFSDSSPHNIDNIKQFIKLCRMRGIKVAVDLSAGYPGENPALVETALSVIAEAEPNKIGINQFFRLYEDLPIMRDLFSESGTVQLLGNVENNLDMLKPLFATVLDPEWLAEVTLNNRLFFIEGSTDEVNYQRVRN